MAAGKLWKSWKNFSSERRGREDTRQKHSNTHRFGRRVEARRKTDNFRPLNILSSLLVSSSIRRFLSCCGNEKSQRQTRTHDDVLLKGKLEFLGGTRLSMFSTREILVLSSLVPSLHVSIIIIIIIVESETLLLLDENKRGKDSKWRWISLPHNCQLSYSFSTSDEKALDSFNSPQPKRNGYQIRTRVNVVGAGRVILLRFAINVGFVMFSSCSPCGFLNVCV